MLAIDDKTKWVLTGRVKERFQERNLLIADIRYLLKFGYVYDDAEESTKNGFWKYKVEGTTPNSETRTLLVMIIPDFQHRTIKMVTVHWKDN